MLIITFYKYQNEKSHEKTWQVGQPVPKIDWRDVDGVELTADGEELKYIDEWFSNIPCRVGGNPKATTYHGDFAQFIWDNLGDKSS